MSSLRPTIEAGGNIGNPSLERPDTHAGRPLPRHILLEVMGKQEPELNCGRRKFADIYAARTTSCPVEVGARITFAWPAKSRQLAASRTVQRRTAFLKGNNDPLASVKRHVGQCFM